MHRISPVCLCWLVLTTAVAAQGWPQWGGPGRNFMVDATGLAETWSAGGPTQLWSRVLGDGHSSIVVDADRLYTMYSKGEQEFVVALDRTTGKNMVIVTVGGTGQSMMAFDQRTGVVVWKKQTFRLSPSSSTVITVDGSDQVVMAFADHFVGLDPNNGDLLWQQRTRAAASTSPHRCGARTTFCSSLRPTAAAVAR